MLVTFCLTLSSLSVSSLCKSPKPGSPKPDPVFWMCLTSTKYFHTKENRCSVTLLCCSVTLYCTPEGVIRFVLLLGCFYIHLLGILKFFLTWIDAYKAGIRSNLRERWGWSLSPSCLHWEWEGWSKWWEKPAAKPHQHRSAGDVHIRVGWKKVICLSISCTGWKEKREWYYGTMLFCMICWLASHLTQL